jgi:hypothetical protein
MHLKKLTAAEQCQTAAVNALTRLCDIRSAVVFDLICFKLTETISGLAAASATVLFARCQTWHADRALASETYTNQSLLSLKTLQGMEYGIGAQFGWKRRKTSAQLALPSL